MQGWRLFGIVWLFGIVRFFGLFGIVWLFGIVRRFGPGV
jgi:hypothetical protein